ncbi:hypothetical protein [Curtobacterium sp. MCSS17_016]|uniref:hypothetical protein n=1 Tax=Curtobacterium sp. MCSS17_016 TaxID=2175644 RepID=UPI000DA80696|nr:hypothetical protein [Curtobacterium sp. MCSS17_016]WIE80546.1 hypothetical protein DEJ19_008260 [Curtobacterium sp. MCSS17_016]
MHSAQAPLSRLIVAFVALVALLFAVITAAVIVLQAYVEHTGRLGDCMHIGLCTGTPLATVENRTGVTLPEGSTLIKSKASRDGQFMSALVRLPADTNPPTLRKGNPADLTQRASAALTSQGAATPSGQISGNVALFSGTSSGHTIVYLRYDAHR